MKPDTDSKNRSRDTLRQQGQPCWTCKHWHYRSGYCEEKDEIKNMDESCNNWDFFVPGPPDHK